MNILFITHFFVGLRFLVYREYPYSGIVRIRLLFIQILNTSLIFKALFITN